MLFEQCASTGLLAILSLSVLLYKVYTIYVLCLMAIRRAMCCNVSGDVHVFELVP